MKQSIKNILERCGGTLEVAYRLKIHQLSVERWKKNGIPEEHWGLIKELGDVTVNELHKANQGIRNDSKTNN